MKKFVLSLMVSTALVAACSKQTKDSPDTVYRKTVDNPSLGAPSSLGEISAPIAESIGSSRLFSLEKERSKKRTTAVHEALKDIDVPAEPQKKAVIKTAKAEAKVEPQVLSVAEVQPSAAAPVVVSTPVASQLTTPVAPGESVQIFTISKDGGKTINRPVTPIVAQQAAPLAQPVEIAVVPPVQEEVLAPVVTSQPKRMPASIAYKMSRQEYIKEPKVYAEKKDKKKSGGLFSLFGSDDEEKQPKAATPAPVAVVAGSSSLPAPESANIGECMAEVKVLGEYKNVEEQVLVKEASSKTVQSPAEYKEVEEQIVVKEASTKLVEIAATYKTVEEQVVVSAERTEEVVTPAIYNDVTERVMVSPAQKTWKKQSDGVMKLVEEPAKYENVTKKVLVTEERRERKTIPAVTKLVSKQVVDSPARTEKQTVPAVTKTIKKQVLVKDSETRDVTIPAEYKTVSKRVAVTPDRTEWQPVLCAEDLNRETVKRLQGALIAKGYDLKVADGVMGSATKKALKDYEKSLGIESKGVTRATLSSLGIAG